VIQRRFVFSCSSFPRRRESSNFFCIRLKRFRLTASYFSLIAPKEKVTKRKGAFPIRANSVVGLIGHFQTRHPWLDLKTARILRAALRVGATTGVMLIFSGKSSSRAAALSLTPVGAASAAMRNQLTANSRSQRCCL
jgi:hypothetical protein